MKNSIFAIGLMMMSFVKGQTHPKPYGALPSKRQLAWHDVEVYGIVHFTPTTFQNKEWGYGDADPKIFNPSSFSAEQIIRAAKDGGLKGIVIVAKHHDGFALWPTKTTKYNITASPYRNGHGDLVKEYEDAANKYGLKFGIYCSPWDRNNPLYGTNDYPLIYREQLKELYTNCGELFISWHDGANGGDGYYGGAREKRSIDRSTYYDWANTWNNLTRRLQPMANIFSDIGWDVRWAGTESGTVPDTSWETFTPKPAEGTNVAVPGQSFYSENPGGTRNGKYWMPAECDVPLRRGWFYHKDEKPKSPEKLFDLYLKSVGHGAALDLGLAPDSVGQLCDEDVKVLKGFGSILKHTFKNNLAKNAEIGASNSRGKRYSTKLLLDGDKTTYWATSDSVHEASLAFTLGTPTTFDIISLQEYIPLGQRIEAFNVEIFENAQWHRIFEGTSIGAKRLIRLKSPVTTSKIRINITRSPVCITLSEVGLYKVSLH